MAEKILVVDDDENILAAYKRILRNFFNVETANSGKNGLLALHTQGPFAVIVSDYNMPGMDGLQFLLSAKAVSPASVGVLLTGQVDNSVVLNAVKEGHVFTFLKKPCLFENMLKAIQSAIRQHQVILASNREIFKSPEAISVGYR